MGGVVSTIKILIGFCISLRSSLAPVVQRIKSDPGQPHPTPTTPFWLRPPHSISDHQSPELPTEVDIVIIGSGITGVSIAKTLLEPPSGKAQDAPPRVAMLEAREACSGATGRNGGHIKEGAYGEYESLKKKHGKEQAMEIIRFRLAHLDALIAVAEGEGEEVLKSSQIRRCNSVDVCFEEKVWEGAKKKLELFLEDFEDQRGLWVAHEKDEARKLYPFPTAIGAISYRAGAVWPYRLITPILHRLLTTHPHFTLDTKTPALAINISPTHPSHYLITTPRGNILTKHIIHATNAHAAHLLPGLRGVLFPVRGHMTAQRPTPGPNALGEDTNHSYSFLWSEGFDYLTQVPGDPDTMVLLGGGLFQSGNNGFGEVGTKGDDEVSIFSAAHLGGVLGAATGRAGITKVEDVWTGVMGFTPDSMAWVGEVPVGVSGREKMCGGSEWVAAGFCGEGMVNSWLSGVAVARMVAGEVDVGLPKAMLCTEERVKSADLLELVQEYLG